MWAKYLKIKKKNSRTRGSGNCRRAALTVIGIGLPYMSALTKIDLFTTLRRYAYAKKQSYDNFFMRAVRHPSRFVRDGFGNAARHDPKYKK